MSIQISLLHATFHLSLYPRQITQWRGAVAKQAGWEEEVFHNHAGEADKFHYGYPLVQYRTEKGKAGILALNQGAEAVKNWLFKAPDAILLGDRLFPLRIADFSITNFQLEICEPLHTYRLLDWLPLNPENYKRWLQADDLIARIELLNSILLSNLLAMAEGLGWRIPGKVDVRLLLIREMRKVRHHETDHIALNVLFKTNILLPPGIALGKGVSHGFGVLQPVKARDEG